MMSFFSNLASGFILTILIFISTYYIFKIPELHGHWMCILTYETSSLSKYKGMVLTYKVLLWQEGKKLYGTGEKTQAELQDGTKEIYDPGKRIQIEVSGYINKKYHTRSQIVFHIKEEGTLRKSSTIQIVKFKKGKLVGNFISTIADSAGLVKWHKA